MSPASARGRLALGALLLLAAASLRAANLHGRLELTDLGAFSRGDSLDSALGERNRNDVAGDLRLIWARRWGRWDADVHYDLAGDAGSGVSIARSRASLFPSMPPATYFHMVDTLVDRPRALATQKIDRLSIGYSVPELVVRVGRQALTWGAGTMFHPMDLVDPFAPDTIDTEYKPGADMAYVQRLFDDGSDLQVVAVPRADHRGGAPRAGASTFALHYHGAIGALGVTWLLARDRGDWTAALGVGGPLQGAVWNAEIVPTFERHGAVKTSVLLNLSDAATILDRNATLFAEYYRNGFGVARRGTPIDALPGDLAARLTRGQVFNTSRSYIAGGMSLEWTPLLTLSPSLIVNLDDASAYATGEANWSLGDNTNLIFGAQVPIGRHGSEYGGLPVSGAMAPYAAPAATAYVQLRRHF